ncbi:pts system mannose-specific iib component [Liquorilactobacillus aquaticus DSM 21051]|uniref:Pts system mannose-specific iib component n=1 Tax=Liquorilactobacillus aquaticus DSM 21051 TaxID=1423725 RepID=A0A0R2CU42_9LACO|nr:mannose/fructose/sorbose PTS transporter subunit IIB [Liquorilactobacillus aquaticus]KRM95297.1 pts system mannose-specific iib component [Liquorilactobacillus aquaticus DSM 21051]
MKITVTRIDDRYIHGQVLTKWIKLLPAERIIVVSDEVAEDPMRKTLVLSVAPSNVKANAVTPEKMGRVFQNPKYAETTAMLLFGNPGEIVEAIENGVDIKTVNVGGMRFDPKKTQITESVSVAPEDVEAFKKLSDMGVKLELRQLPGDSSQDFAKILKQKI